MATPGVTHPKPPTPSPKPAYDPLAQFSGPAASQVDFREASRTILAIILLAAGVGVSLWLVYLIHGAVFRPEQLGMLRLGLRAEDLAMTLPAGKIQLPPAAVTLIGYVLLILLAAIGGKIASALVRQGVVLIREKKSTPSDSDDSDASDS